MPKKNVKSLEKEIEKKKVELAKLEKEVKERELEISVRTLAEYSDTEKIAWFNEIHKYAMDQLKRHVNGDIFFEDGGKYFMGEALLEILAKGNSVKELEAFWEFWNKL